MGKMLERNLQQIARVTKGLCLHKNSHPKGLSAPAPGLYTCIKHEKLCIKSDFKDIFLKLATNGQSDKAFLLTSGFGHKGAIYMWKNIKKMCIKAEFEEICLKLATNGRSDKGFLLTSKVLYRYKIIKNVYKIRFRRDHFETCNIRAKRKGVSVVIKILSPMDCLPLPEAIYIW